MSGRGGASWVRRERMRVRCQMAVELWHAAARADDAVARAHRVSWRSRTGGAGAGGTPKDRQQQVPQAPRSPYRPRFVLHPRRAAVPVRKKAERGRAASGGRRGAPDAAGGRRSSSGRARRRRSAPRCAPCAAAGRRSAVSLYDSDRSQRGWRRSHCVVEERLRVEVRLILQASRADGRDNGFHCGEENGFRALRPGTASGTTWSVGVRILPRTIGGFLQRRPKRLLQQAAQLRRFGQNVQRL